MGRGEEKEGTSGVDLESFMTVGVDSGNQASNNSVNGQPNHLELYASIPS